MKLPESSWFLVSAALLVTLLVACSIGSWSNVLVLGPGEEVRLPPAYRGYLVVASSLKGDGGFRVAGEVFVGAEGIPKAVYVSPTPLPVRDVELTAETYTLAYVSATGPYMILVVSLVIAGASLLVERRRRRQVVALLALLVIALSAATLIYSWYYWTTPTIAETHALLSADYRYIIGPGSYRVIVAARGPVLLQTPGGNITLINSTTVFDLSSGSETVITAYNLAPGVSAPLLHIIVWRSWSPPNPALLSWATLLASLVSLAVASRSGSEEHPSLIGERDQG